MNARLIALATLLDVVVLVGLGLGLFFAPLTLVWAFDDGFSTNLLSSWGVAVDGWLLGHGVPLQFVLSPELADSLALGALAREFTVDIALLGVAVLTLLWGYRIARRDGARAYPFLTWFLAVGTMVGLSYLLVLSLPEQVVGFSLLDALVRPALFLAAGMAIATWVGEESAGNKVVSSLLPENLWSILRTGTAAGIASVAGVIGVASLAVSGLLVSSFGTVIGLYESLQPSLWGIVVLSMAQLAILPTIIVWATAWIVGPGFSLGVGALISPLGTNLQAVPALPILGIIPSGVADFAVMVIAIPAVVAFVAGLASRSRLLSDQRGGLWRDMSETDFFHQPVIHMVAAALWAGVVVSALGAALAALTGGHMGPGRFTLVGADPGQIALWWGLEVFIGVALGLLSGGLARSANASSR